MNSGGRPDPVRARITELTERLHRDAAFRDQVAADPEGELTAVGLPGEAILDFLAEHDLAPDVKGYLLEPTGGCVET